MPQKARARRQKQLLSSHNSVLSAPTTSLLAGRAYKPATRETALVYDTLLSFVRSQLLRDAAQPPDVLASAAEETLAVLKDERLTLAQQQAEIEQLMQLGHSSSNESKSSSGSGSSSGLSADTFRQLVNIGKRITDWTSQNGGSAGGEDDNSSGSGASTGMRDATGGQDDPAALAAAVAAAGIDGSNGNIDDKLGVAIVFDEDAGGDEGTGAAGKGALDRVAELDDELDEGERFADELMEADDENTADTLKPAKRSRTDSTAARGDQQLDVRSIDAHWLQRQVAAFTPDAVSAQTLADNLWSVLSSAVTAEHDSSNSSSNDGPVENQLVTLLGFDHFTLIKLLLRHRQAIVWCMRLARAGNSSTGTERQQLEAQMRADARLASILAQLNDAGGSTTGAAGADDLRTAAKCEPNSVDGISSSNNSDGSSTYWHRKPRAVIDLQAAAFREGGHLLSVSECKLPTGSVILTHKGHQEVHVPALEALPLRADEVLRTVSSLPAWTRPAFSGMTQLNRIQSAVCGAALESSHNLLMCAPTGAGKTNVAMLAILREIGQHLLHGDGAISGDRALAPGVSVAVDTSAFQIVYIAPMKSLVQEVVLNLTPRLRPYGLTVAELSGDVSLTRAQLAAVSVIVTTPEKWDVVTRKGGERAAAERVRLDDHRRGSPPP